MSIYLNLINFKDTKMITKRRIFCFLPFMITPGAYAASAGTVEFNGEIIAGTCTIKSSDVNKVVTLPEVSSENLRTSGSTAGSKVFTIEVSNCATTINGVTAHFEAINGTTGYDVQTNNLTNDVVTDATATPPVKAAGNVQIRLFDKGGTTQVQVGGTDGAFVRTNAAHGATMEYVASYYATGAATEGTVHANVAYTLAYN
ncbi:fimbrial protein [Rosenbergiella nectarea]|uniref:fimbrial protein n=1 Tax=Rosenbergiella nectarea TaxID=988801 RepID=UPI001F4DAF9F|nr:fimbrial protein [Rosenbergiella nectarea]